MNDFGGLMDLVKARWVQVRYSEDGRLAIFKYHLRVFFDSLWSESDLLLKAREHVYDVGSKKLVVNPLDKIFNYKEQSAGLDTPDDTEVIAVQKVNGYMASVTSYNGEPLVTTTGSLDSPYVDLAKKHLLSGSYIYDLLKIYKDRTFVFEICDESDPHIIEEKPGIYFLGTRGIEEGSPFLPAYIELVSGNDSLDQLPLRVIEGTYIPFAKRMTFSEALKEGYESSREGIMIVDAKTGSIICKHKSRKYLGLKLLARSKRFFAKDASKEKLRKILDEEFYHLIDIIFDEYGQEHFLALDEQKKLELLRHFL